MPSPSGEERLVVGAEAELARRMWWHRIGIGDRQQLQEGAAEQRHAVADAERELADRRQGEAQGNKSLGGALQVANAEHAVVETTWHRITPAWVAATLDVRCGGRQRRVAALEAQKIYYKRPAARRHTARPITYVLPLSALRAFEAAARHLSFKLAAQELHVRPGAIGQQVKALENRWACGCSSGCTSSWS